MNVLILEDEQRSAERLAGLLAQCDPTIRVLAMLPSVAQGLTWFATPDQGPGQSDHPDLLLLDIHLEDRRFRFSQADSERASYGHRDSDRNPTH